MRTRIRSGRANRNGGASPRRPRGAGTYSRTIVTLGDLVAAAYEVGGSAVAAARLLSPPSPLYRLLNRRIVFGT